MSAYLHGVATAINLGAVNAKSDLGGVNNLVAPTLAFSVCAGRCCWKINLGGVNG